MNNSIKLYIWVFLLLAVLASCAGTKSGSEIKANLDKFSPALKQAVMSQDTTTQYQVLVSLSSNMDEKQISDLSNQGFNLISRAGNIITGYGKRDALAYLSNIPLVEYIALSGKDHNFH